MFNKVIRTPAIRGLSPEQLTNLKLDIYLGGTTLSEISKKYGVAYQTVRNLSPYVNSSDYWDGAPEGFIPPDGEPASYSSPKGEFSEDLIKNLTIPGVKEAEAFDILNPHQRCPMRKRVIARYVILTGVASKSAMCRWLGVSPSNSANYFLSAEKFLRQNNLPLGEI